MTDQPVEVLTRDLTSGRIHRRIAVAGGYMSLEADNLDEAGEFEIATAEDLEKAEAGQLCERCFPDIPAPREDDAA